MEEPEYTCKSCFQLITEKGKMTCPGCGEPCCVSCWRDGGGTCGWPDCKR